MSGNKGSLNDVLEGLRIAQDVGFDSLKINVVIQRSINDKDILELVNYFRHTKHILRFIEFMDVGNCNNWSPEQVVPSKEILNIINAKYPLKPSESNYFGEVAERYEFIDGSGEIGFISSISQPFCRSCTRARLTADGQFVTCLFAKNGLNLRDLLRGQAPDDQVLEAIKNIWINREDRYSELRNSPQAAPSEKVEMFQIGG
jgi:cyclic pyranopterin phosphate synthase